ncbi:MAG: DivIVA domain-containing protein [Candidatus Krumholzibacteriia bacterium]
MRLTPLDIREQQFRRVMRGLDPEEVSAFLASVAGEYEALVGENKELRQRVLEFEEKLNEYRSMEKALRDTLLTAERVMTESKESAQREAGLVIREAELAARRATARIAQDVVEMRRELAELRRVKDAYLSRVRWLVRSHLDIIEGHAQEFTEVDAGLGPEPGGATATRGSVQLAGADGIASSAVDAPCGAPAPAAAGAGGAAPGPAAPVPEAAERDAPAPGARASDVAAADDAAPDVMGFAGSQAPRAGIASPGTTGVATPQTGRHVFRPLGDPAASGSDALVARGAPARGGSGAADGCPGPRHRGGASLRRPSVGGGPLAGARGRGWTGPGGLPGRHASGGRPPRARSASGP